MDTARRRARRRRVPDLHHRDGAHRAAGVHALELAQLFARLGTRVTIAETLDRLAPFDEPEVSAAIEDVFDDEGIDILTTATRCAVMPLPVR